MLGLATAFPGLASPSGHAHEMLFGFALAVVAGNQLGPRTPRAITLLLVLWLLARAAFVFFPHTPAAVGANVAFPLLLAWHIAPRLFGSAKKWRNQALPAVLTAICASAVVFAFALEAYRASWIVPLPAPRVLRIAVALFALLLLFMGGRLIAPAVAGEFYRRGGNLAARVQPRVEGALILVMGVATLAMMLDDADGARGSKLPAGVAGGLLVVAGLLAAIRLARWRPWRLRGRSDLLCLAAGYGWLALGLVLFGAAHGGLAMGARGETLALHVITIGSLGTLTLNVMAMTWLLKSRRNAAATRLPTFATLLLALATLLRVFVRYDADDTQALLLLAATCWSAAFCLLLLLLIATRPPLHAASMPAMHARQR